MNSKKDSRNFLVQGSILAVAAIIAKVIGLVYRLPLTNILGDSGNSYYSTANEIYSIILIAMMIFNWAPAVLEWRERHFGKLFRRHGKEAE